MHSAENNGTAAKRVQLAARTRSGAAVPVAFMGLNVKATVVGACSEVCLLHTFLVEGGAAQVEFSFPADTKAAVFALEADVDGAIIRAVIKERDVARRVFAQAISDGRSAQLLERTAGDLYSLSLGSVKAGSLIRTRIHYVAPLAEDRGMVRFRLPISVCPRYNPATGGDAAVAAASGKAHLGGGSASAVHFYFSLDCTMESAITAIKSKTHDIHAHFGGALTSSTMTSSTAITPATTTATTTTTTPSITAFRTRGGMDVDNTPEDGFITPTDMALDTSDSTDDGTGTTTLATSGSDFDNQGDFDNHQGDFDGLQEALARSPRRGQAHYETNALPDRELVVLIQLAQPPGPRMIVEHNAARGSWTIAMTFCPRFELQAQSREFVFLVDLSGSMQGAKIEAARGALGLFLAELPSDCCFNIIGFGSRFAKLWPESRPNSAANLAEATAHCLGLQANMGGTELMQPLRDLLPRTPAISHERQVFLLTDGAVSNADAVAAEVRAHRDSNRVFTLGVGAGVSHDLIEKVATAGRGTSQFVHDADGLGAVVVQLLKQAIQPGLHSVKVDWLTALAHGGDDGEEDMSCGDLYDDGVDADDVDAMPGWQPAGADAIASMAAPVASGRIGGSLMDFVAPTPAAGGRWQQIPEALPAMLPNQLYTVFFTCTGSSNEPPPTRARITAMSPHGPLSVSLEAGQGDVVEGDLVHRLAARARIEELELQESVSPAETRAAIVKLATEFQLVSKHTSFVGVQGDGSNSAQPCINAGDWAEAEVAAAAQGPATAAAHRASTDWHTRGATRGPTRGLTRGPNRAPPRDLPPWCGGGGSSSTQGAFRGGGTESAFGGASGAGGGPFHTPPATSGVPAPSLNGNGITRGWPTTPSDGGRWSPTGLRVAEGDPSRRAPAQTVLDISKYQDALGCFELTEDVALCIGAHAPDLACANPLPIDFNGRTGPAATAWMTAILVRFLQLRLPDLVARWVLLVHRALGWLERYDVARSQALLVAAESLVARLPS